MDSNAASSSSRPAAFQYSNATRVTSNVSISVERGGAYFGVAAPKEPNILADIVAVIKKYDLKVKSGRMSQEKSKDLYVIYANVSPLIHSSVLIICVDP